MAPRQKVNVKKNGEATKTWRQNPGKHGYTAATLFTGMAVFFFTFTK